MNQQALESKWQYKLVESKGFYRDLDGQFIVTSCYLSENNMKFAIMATDYSRDNKKFITIDLGPDEINSLDDRFNIVGDYNPFTWDIEYSFHKEEDVSGVVCLIAKTKNHVNDVETDAFLLEKKEYPELNIGDSVHDIAWIATDGRTLRKTILYKKQDLLKNSNDWFKSTTNRTRFWIKSGLYHFADRKELK